MAKGGIPGPPPDKPPVVPPGPGDDLPIVVRDPKNKVALPEFQAEFDAFGCNIPKGNSDLPPDYIDPATLPPFLSDGVTPSSLRVNREFRTADVPMADNVEVRFWGFMDGDRPKEDDEPFPSDIIRVVQGQIFHAFMKPRIGTHTIHWHGIEPTAMNDGVGKLSFEATGGGYLYQWFADTAGTYFYHCHHNTVLHFEMGMYGMLILDPLPPAGATVTPQALYHPAVDPNDPDVMPTFGYGYPTGGPGYAAANLDFVQLPLLQPPLNFSGPPISFDNSVFDFDPVSQTVFYDKEAIWVTDDIDPIWHEYNHDRGIACPFTFDAGLNVFNPPYFVITGVPDGPNNRTANLPTDPNPGVAVEVAAGETLLARLLCAAYFVNRYVFPFDAVVTAVDARSMGVGDLNQYSSPFIIPAGTPFYLTTARRYDLLINIPEGTSPGSYPVSMDYINYLNGGLVRHSETAIIVS